MEVEINEKIYFQIILLCQHIIYHVKYVVCVDICDAYFLCICDVLILYFERL